MSLLGCLEDGRSSSTINGHRGVGQMKAGSLLADVIAAFMAGVETTPSQDPIRDFFHDHVRGPGCLTVSHGRSGLIACAS